jgi:hypothetical protein
MKAGTSISGKPLPPEARSSKFEARNFREILALAAILCLSFAVRWPFRNALLVRDEGEYTYLGQEILRGAIPYLDVYNQKTPFAFYLMAGVQAVAGRDLAALRLATAAYGLVTTVLVYFLARRLWGTIPALGSAFAFSLLTFNQCGTKHSASTEFFMLLWMALAVTLWYLGRSPRRTWLILLAGIAAGAAYQTKQTGIAVPVFFLLERLWARLRQAGADSWGQAAADVVLVIAGWATVFLAILWLFDHQGAAAQYLECTWTNNWEYVGHRHHGVGSLAGLAGKALTSIAGWDTGLWILGSLGLVFVAVARPAGQGSGLWILLLLTAAAALAAGNAYVHYYELLILPLALGSGVALHGMIRFAQERATPPLRGLAVLVLVFPWLLSMIGSGTLLRMSDKERRADAPFDVAPRVARYLADRTSPDECFLIIGSEPEMYYYADRRACTRFVFTYPLIAPYSYSAQLREEFQDDFESHLPRYIVLMRSADSFTEWNEQLARFLRPVANVINSRYILDSQFTDQGEVVARIFRHADRSAKPSTNSRT